MGKRFLVPAVAMLIIAPVAVTGCKARQKPVEVQNVEIPEVTMTEDLLSPQAPLEPSQMVATETIPPTANPPVKEAPVPVAQVKQDRSKDIQKALKIAGFYEGAVDGKIGPRTKKAILDFQKAKGLKADGVVGPKTWAELEKYLVQ